jgi:NADH:ubiquinone oxidoreductase subunit K
MDSALLNVFWTYSVYVIVLFVIGLYCILVTLNLVRALVGIEILMKAVTLLLVIAGFTCGRSALTQSLIITLIVIETVFIAIAMGIVLGVQRQTGSLETKNLTKLKG